MNKVLELVNYTTSTEDDGDKDWKLIAIKDLCTTISNDSKLMEKIKILLDD